jgi:hypothetical protein
MARFSWLSADLDALALLYTLPHPAVKQARDCTAPFASARELYRQLHERLSLEVGASKLAALGLPEAISEERDGAPHVQATSFPYVEVGVGCFQQLSADDERCQAIMAASLAKLELRRERRCLREVREVLALVPKTQLALALFDPERCRADGLGFLHLEILLTQQHCDQALLEESVEAHLAYMGRQRREYGYRLAGGTLLRVLMDAVEASGPLQEEVFQELLEHFPDASVKERANLKMRLALWQLKNRRPCCCPDVQMVSVW